MNNATPPKSQKPWPIWQRMALRVLGIALVLLAIKFYVKGYYDFQAGDIQIGHNYKGMEIVSNRAERISFVLAVAGVIIFGLSFPCNETTDKNDKDSS